MKNYSEALTFFRQSGWMVLANTLSGFFMFAVHLYAKYMDEAEYGVFQTMLQVLNLMLIPAIGLQTVFAQETAAALTPEQKARLIGSVRGVLQCTFLIWLAIVVTAFVARGEIISTLKINNPAALWVTVCGGLVMMWLPIAQGILQGQQNFLWLGWTATINGFGRFVAIGLLVWLMSWHTGAAGGLTGAMLGMWIALSVGAWQSRSAWKGQALPFDWRSWVNRVVPLTLGLGAGMFMLSFDQIIVQSLFDRNQTPLYAAAGMIARGLVIFTSPLTAVMFPKIVQSAARSQRSDVLAQAVGATALLGGAGALFCTLWPSFLLKLVYKKPAYLAAADYLPWFVWSMLPLAIANVLVSNLLARGRFGSVKWLLLVAASYAAALTVYNDSFLTVIKTVGLFNLILMLVTFLLTWMDARGASRRSEPQNPGNTEKII